MNNTPVGPDDVDWKWCTFEGSELHTMLAGFRMTFREKLEWLEEAGRVSDRLRASRDSRNIPPPPNLQPSPFTLQPLLLSAVFWDYPQFTDEQTLREALRTEASGEFHRWVLLRFMRHGRVVDAFCFFTLSELEQGIPLLKGDAYTARKWKRVIEVYHESGRG
jgi:hypothetical protein